MEVACYPDSILGTEVERRFGSGSCLWLSEWNGGNLETPEGIDLILKKIKRSRPLKLWISCECSPFCPLQRLNRRTPEHRLNLSQKQDRAITQYQGAIQVAEFAFKLGVDELFELSQRCEAWNLPCIEQYLQKNELEKVSTAGCKTRDQTKLLRKAWTVATKNTLFLQRMNLQCQQNHAKGRCEAGETSHTARYTTAFARRVVDCFCESEGWGHIVQELRRPIPEDAYPAVPDDEELSEAGELLEISPEEKRDIEQKIQRIHKNTGHGSMKNLIQSLRRRGVAEKVLQVAKQWKFPSCAEKKFRDPRRFATLETVAAKWEVLEVDAAAWLHPIHQTKCQIAVMVDSGSRFTVCRLLHEHPTKTGTWEDFKRALEEQWLPIFGKPKTVRQFALIQQVHG